MSKRSVTLALVIGLLTGCISCIFAGSSYRNWSNSYNESHPEVKPPIKTLSIELDVEHRERLFEQLQQFSEKHHLQYHLSLNTRESTNDTFLVEMRWQNFHISAASKPITQTEIDFYFTVDDPTNPPSQETVSELYNDLKVFINKTPSAKIINEK